MEIIGPTFPPTPERPLRHVRTVFGSPLYVYTGPLVPQGSYWVGTLDHADLLGYPHDELIPYLDTLGPFVGE